MSTRARWYQVFGITLAILSGISERAFGADGTVWKKTTVKPGESLSEVSSRVYGTSRLWENIFAANRSKIPHATLVQEGQQLNIPLVTEYALSVSKLKYIYRVSHIEEVRMQVAEKLNISYATRGATPVLASSKKGNGLAVSTSGFDLIKPADATKLSVSKDTVKIEDEPKKEEKVIELGSMAPASAEELGTLTEAALEKSARVPASVKIESKKVESKTPNPVSTPSQVPQAVEFTRFSEWEVSND